MIKLFKLASSVILLCLASLAAQAGLVVDAGEVTGVTDIEIGGELRAFDFVDGTFNDLFAGVAYSFDTGDAARQIADMFTGTSFVNIPVSVRGCEESFRCAMVLPASLVGGGTAQSFAELIDRGVPFSFTLDDSFGVLDSDFDLSLSVQTTFAVLRPSAVPEPSTMGLLGLSLLGLGFAGRARNEA